MTMEETIRRLGDAELEIMQAVWAAGEPVSSTYVQQALRGRRDWALGALMTALGRLCDKGFLRREKQGRNNLYAPLIDERTYQQREGRIIRQLTYEREEKFTYSHFFRYLADSCDELDVPTPVLLKTSIFNYAKFNHVIFRPSDFMEEVPFDRLVLENIL